MVAARVEWAQGSWGREVVATLALSAPMVLINLTQAGLGATDVLMIAWLGPEALSAAALGTNLFFVCYIGGLGLISAISAMIAAERGANRFAVREVRRSFRQGLWSAVAIAVPVWAALWHAEPLLVLFGQEPALAAAAAEYLRYQQWALFPMLCFVALRFFLAGMERPAPALVVGLAAIGVNALCNYALIFGNFGLPALGLVGAGLATTTTAWFMFFALAALARADRRIRRYRLFGRFWRPDWPRFVELWRLGAPIAATILFEVTIFSAALLLMGMISADALAAHAVAIQIASLAFMIPLGVGQAATVRVGLAYGARDETAIARAGWTAFALGTSFMLLSAALMIGAPRLLVGAFLDLDDPGNAIVVGLAVSYLALGALFQLADGAQAVGSGMLRGLHDTRIPMLYAGFGYWVVGFPLAAGLGLWTPLGGVGVWLGLAAGLAVVAVMMLVRWMRRDANGLAPKPLSMSVMRK
ncbi:MAG: MATE family efflux transporter [Microvirga sp.]|nr:MATE family efflux transporter [Microvirga sp.]